MSSDDSIEKLSGEDLSLPKATIDKLINDRFAKESKNINQKKVETEPIEEVVQEPKKKPRKKKAKEKPIVLKKYSMMRDVKENLMKSALEFIHLITAEANDVCEKDNKKTITHEHVISALSNLGYSDYKQDCLLAHEDFAKINQLRPGKSNKFKESGLSLEQLLEEQTALFENAKRALNNNNADFSNPNSSGLDQE